MKALRDGGYHGTFFVNSGGLVRSDLHQLGQVADGTQVAPPLPPSTAAGQFPAWQQMLKDFKAAYDAGDTKVPYDGPKASAEQGWLAMQMLAKLMGQLDTIDKTSVLNALNSRPSIDTLGSFRP
jgi:ABC-type branched-subunit amino acid transport system substrate-binding protein